MKNILDEQDMNILEIEMKMCTNNIGLRLRLGGFLPNRLLATVPNQMKLGGASQMGPKYVPNP
uniref:Uncharacterized protein n=1 Tax=Arundo donax TaxID=35708 RepID=A0A0A8ZY90_ARUDO